MVVKRLTRSAEGHGQGGSQDATVELSLKNIRVSFGGVVALDDVSLDLTGPSIVGVIGPNGSGKSTAIGVMSGLIRPDRGTVALDGTSMTGKSPIAFGRSGVRRSFQSVRLVPSLTIYENLLVGIGRPRSEDLDRARHLVETFGLQSVLARWPASVPAGVQRLVQVASVVLAQPRVVLLDEPAAGLTDQESSELAEIVRSCG
jgi:branched-chain amino acid transport system ATP-binding protein